MIVSSKITHEENALNKGEKKKKEEIINSNSNSQFVSGTHKTKESNNRYRVTAYLLWPFYLE